MKVYVYCSYNNSPVGYVLGCFETQIEQGKISLSNNELNLCIVKSFDNSPIKSIYGKLPESNNYVTMIKKIKFKDSTVTGTGAMKYINLAFETNDKQEFKKIVNHLNCPDERKIADFIIPDPTNHIYGLHIDGMKFSEWLNSKPNDSKTASPSPNYDEDRFNVIPSVNLESYETAIKSQESLEKIFGIYFTRCGDFFTQTDVKILPTAPKKHPQIKKVLIPIFIVIVIILVAVALIQLGSIPCKYSNHK